MELAILSLGLPCLNIYIRGSRAPKRNQPSLFKKALLDRRCPNNALNTFVFSSAPFSHAESLAAPRKTSMDEPHAGKLARVVLIGDPGILY
ncbi:hypothetical protein AMTR_s00065p00126250 [Amborella trichopoda]|uniref:Uncharacterized protein n=1 Tax=Amborella trichopoda TaxID=13333 RepID=U5DAX9_AMBTC|nr:hypothetical protein AMTR_s00065p00126250 [Amborella trichopoda]